MFWVGGEAALTGDRVVCNPGDRAAQVPNCITNFSRILQELGSDLADLVKLLCFYANDGSVDEYSFLSMVAQALPAEARPAITAIPVPYLAYPDLPAEVGAYAW